MYHILRQRLHDSIYDAHETLLTMTLDPRLMPAEHRIVHSSASTPSLRSRDGTLPLHARMDGGGNVKVVVRVRAFLKRGEHLNAKCLYSFKTSC